MRSCEEVSSFMKGTEPLDQRLSTRLCDVTYIDNAISIGYLHSVNKML